MHSYHALVHQVLNTGERRPNRTGIDTIGTFGAFFVHDMQEGFPLPTTKKMNTAPIAGELTGFIRGVTSAADMREFGAKIWDDNANKEPGWLANPFRLGEDDLGPVYGAQWRAWRDVRLVEGSLEDPHIKRFIDRGYSVDYHQEQDGTLTVKAVYKEIDQLQDLIDAIRNNPESRRHVVTAWNPSEVDKVALPACHFAFQCNVRGDVIDLQFHMRSADLFLGVPFNIASYAMLLMVICQLTGKTPGRLSATFGDLHIYENHLEQITEQITRAPYPLPTMTLDPIIGLDDVTPDKFHLENYQSHPALKGVMAV